MKLVIEKKLIALSLITFFVVQVFAQTTVPQGVNFQGIARNSSGALMSNKSVAIKLGILDKLNVLEWEEIHAATTNQFGLFSLIIGQGTSTGNGVAVSFSEINWQTGNHYIVTAIDPAGGSSFTVLDTVQFWSVPYSLHAASSGKLVGAIRLNDLTDVDTSGVKKGDVLKWDGSIWKPEKDNGSDTAQYAFNADHSINSDTATFVLKANHSIKADTALYSFNSKMAVKSTSSNYCDTAVYALNIVNNNTNWNLNGNSGTDPATNFIGTIDNKDVVIKTNNTERLRILANGKVGIGVAAPTASFQVNGVDGILATGAVGSGAVSSPGAGTRMHWYPKKAAFRAGSVSSTQWDDAKIGMYSFAVGSNNTASGAYSTVAGENNTAAGTYSVSMGDACSSGKTSSVSIGSACNASGEYAVALGRAISASDSSSVGIGYHSTATGKYALALGAYTDASGPYSTAMGYYASTNGKRGSFVYADNSSATVTSSTVDNQFLVRASGGVIFYSNSALTVGVSLPAGGGSWASVSDKNKKENFSNVDGERILKGIQNLEITKWNYKTQASSIKHIGPMAQDLYKEFNLGESELTITAVDMDGINLMALKTLAIKTDNLEKKAGELEVLKQKIEKLEKEKALLEKRILSMEHQLKATSK